MLRLSQVNTLQMLTFVYNLLCMCAATAVLDQADLFCGNTRLMEFCTPALCHLTCMLWTQGGLQCRMIGGGTVMRGPARASC